MPRVSGITAALVDEVQLRREAGECWKLILADLRGRGLPCGRTTWFRALPDEPRGVPEHMPAGQDAGLTCSGE